MNCHNCTCGCPSTCLYSTWPANTHVFAIELNACLYQYSLKNTLWIFSTFVRTMMTSSNGNIFRVTGPLCKEFTGHRWIPLTKASDAELWCFLWYSPNQTVEWTIQTLVILDAIRRAHCDGAVMRAVIYGVFYLRPFMLCDCTPY